MPIAPVRRWLPQLRITDRRPVRLRVHGNLWADMVQHVSDFSKGEQAGVLFVRPHPARDPETLTGEAFLPVPESYVLDRRHGLAYDGRFSLRAAEHAIQIGCGAILVHSHPHDDPAFPSRTDRQKGLAFLQFMRRRVPEATHGLLILGQTTVSGIVSSDGEQVRVILSAASAGTPLQIRRSANEPDDEGSDDRQLLAIGAYGQHQLARSSIGIVGISGGGSHVAQQLIHAGVGTLIAVDHELVTTTNLRRLVGSVATDIDVTPKPDVAVRLAAAVRPLTRVIPIRAPFPSAPALSALRAADLIIGCVDGWDVRDDLNNFALAERLPYIDIGASIQPAGDGLPMRIGGQVAVVIPGGPCLRCMGLVDDVRVAEAREHRHGYSPDTPSPQVVSINGTLASEAVTAALMLLAGADDVARYRRYKSPPGLISQVTTLQRPDCRSCAAARVTTPPDGGDGHTADRRARSLARGLPHAHVAAGTAARADPAS
jgi:molybdopterin-synthase adenylyltransferase